MLIENFIKTAKSNFNKTVLMDSLGTSLTYGQTLTAGLLLSKHMRGFAGKNIALLFPASVGGALAYLATAFAGKTPVGINFLSDKTDQDHALELCEVKTILTSSTFIEKANIPKDPRMVFIEDLRLKTSKLEQMITFFSCKLRSEGSIINKIKDCDRPEKTAIILFTSGSESSPKGVPLSNRNIYSSIDSFSKVFDPIPEDVVLGTLPFFHVFGFVVCLWYPLIMGMGVVFHPNPTEYERLGKIVSKYKATMLLATSTLYRGFMKKWKKEQVSSVRLAFAGAEKLNENVRMKFYEKLGINILEGYGVTESCSCISADNPADFKHGSVGKPLSNVECKLVDPDTFKEVGAEEEGLILIKGPNIMKGYYKSPELTKNAFYDDYYITGDIGKFNDGFLYITDRLKRFAKIGGEMAPLTPIENKLSQILDENVEDEKRNCGVVAIPHAQKGEQIVAFVVGDAAPDKLALNAKLDGIGVTKLSQPDSFLPIEEIPMLPSGKVDYRSLKQKAIDELGS